MNEVFEKKKVAAELWKDHGAFAWTQVRTVPFIEIAILAGAYAVWKDGNNDIAAGLLFVGGFILLGILLLLHRHWQHVDAFRQAADDLVPHPTDDPIFYKSNMVAMLLVLLLSIFNIITACSLCYSGYSFEKTDVDQNCCCENKKNTSPNQTLQPTAKSSG